MYNNYGNYSKHVYIYSIILYMYMHVCISNYFMHVYIYIYIVLYYICTCMYVQQVW